MNDIDWINIARLAEKVLLHPQRTYDWNAILFGAPVLDRGGHTHMLRAISGNTVRALHRADKSITNVDVIARFFDERRDTLLQQLAAIENRTQLDTLSDELRSALVRSLTHVKPAMLGSYNRTRKLVDLALEHLVAMAGEIAPALRARLVPMLYLPLDSRMLGNPALFDTATVQRIAGAAAPGYGEITSRSGYAVLQSALDERCRSISGKLGRSFHPIYCDLLWRERANASGGNLFELNVGGDASVATATEFTRRETKASVVPAKMNGGSRERADFIGRLSRWRPKLARDGVLDYMSDSLMDNLACALGDRNQYGPRLNQGVDLALSLSADRLRTQIQHLIKDRGRFVGAEYKDSIPDEPNAQRALLIALWTVRPVKRELKHGLRFGLVSKRVYGDAGYRPPQVV